jgi:hypothetical protein
MARAAGRSSRISVAAESTAGVRSPADERGEKGAMVPLSEDEQRILHEMEEKLYEHDRGFAGRVRPRSPHSLASRSMRWSALVFLMGFIVLLVSFRSSTLIGTCGFLLMLVAALLFERSARQVLGRQDAAANRRAKPWVLSQELSMIGRRLRSRFGRER